MRYLLFDIDGTLLDFRKSERTSLGLLFGKLGICKSEENYTLYHECNESLWKEYEKGTISQDDIRKNRFRLFFSKIGFDYDHVEADREYEEFLSSHGYLIDGAEDLMEKIRIEGNKKCYAITIGISHVQRGRLKGTGMDKYFEKIFISGEIGVQKPDKAFFDYIFQNSGIVKEESIVIGDGIKSDIAGANNAGLKSILISSEKSDLATYTVRDLRELDELLDHI